MPHAVSHEESAEGAEEPSEEASAESLDPVGSLRLRDVALSAVFGITDAAFLPGWQRLGRKARAWILHDRDHRIDGPPVLLLPGVHESPRFLDPFAALALAQNRRPHVITALGHNSDRITATAELAADYLERHDLRDALIIAHSKGGLVGKQLMTWERTRHRLVGMVAVATPFSGSVYATRAPTRALRDFSPTDATLRDLAANRAANREVVSVYPAFDPQIPHGSELADARANVRLPVAGHFRVLGHPQLWALLRATLSATGGAASFSGTR